MIALFIGNACLKRGYSSEESHNMETDKNQGANNQSANAENKTPAEKTFTQAELDTIIADRLTREKAKYADYETLKDKAAKYDAEADKRTELEKVADKASKLEKQLEAMTHASAVRDIRDKVAAELKVPASLLTADTEADCRVQAQAIIEFARPQYPNVKDGGENQQTYTGDTREQFATWFGQVLNNK